MKFLKSTALILSLILSTPATYSKSLSPKFAPNDKSILSDSVYTATIKKVIRTVVNIQVSFNIVDPETNEEKTQSYIGSGVFIHEKGYILTCGHLFHNVPDTIKIAFLDENFKMVKVSGKLLATDFDNDLALVKIENYDQKVAFAKVASRAAVGQEVIAIGAPLGLIWTVTHGIISSVRRDIDRQKNLIQSDAPINPGNSGGPLFDLNGDIIGINILLVNAAEIPSFCGIGFSVSGRTCLSFLNTYRNLIKE